MKKYYDKDLWWKLLATLITLWCFFGCKSPKPVVLPPAEYKEKVVERLVPYEIPADSTQFYALLACDSLNNVILKEFSEYKGKAVESLFSLNQNKLNYNTYRPPDTVYVKASDSIRIEKTPYPVEVPVKVNELTRFQSFQIKVAWITEIAIICLIAFLLLKINNFSIIKNLIKK